MSVPVTRARRVPTPMPGLGGGSRLVTLLFAVLALAAGALPFWPSYQSEALLIAAGGAIVLGLLLAVVGARFRWPSAVLAPVSASVFLIAGVPLAVPTETIAGVLPTLAGFRTLIASVALGWKQLVTVEAPVGEYQGLLVPAFLLILAASVATPTIALRARHPELAAVPPAVLFALAVVLGPIVPLQPVAMALLLLAILLLWLGWLRWRRRAASVERLAAQSSVSIETRGARRAGAVRGAVASVAVLIVAALIGTLATTALPATAARRVLRSAVEQPFQPRDYPSPLSGFRQYLEPADSATAMLTASGLGADRRIRIATMDAYTGVVYAVGDSTESGSGSFARLPYRLSQDGVVGTRRTVTVRIQGYRGVWVPGAGQLQQISFGGPRADRLANAFFYDDTTGTAADTAGLRAGDTVTAQQVVLPVRTARQLTGARPGGAVLPRTAVVPDDLVTTLQRWTQNAKTPGAKLQAMLTRLAATGYVSHGIGSEPFSRSGHGADRISQLLTQVPMLGDQEQYSVLAALMARQLGFPARVAFGFEKPGRGSGAVTFRGRDVSAWIEVQVRGTGWVTIDPTPPVRPIPKRKPDVPQQVSRPQTIVQPPPAPSEQNPQQTPRSHVSSKPPARPDPILAALLAVAGVLGWVLLGAAILAAPFAAVLGAKLRRRALRRRVADPVERITGGWHEFVDAALDHGAEPPPSATRRELADALRPTGAAALAERVDRAVFGPTAPPTAEADAVWDEVARLRAELDGPLTRRQRLRAALSLRSLGGYRGPVGIISGTLADRRGRSRS